MSHALVVFLLWLVRIEAIYRPIYLSRIHLPVPFSSFLSWPHISMQISIHPRNQVESFFSFSVFISFLLVTISTLLLDTVVLKLRPLGLFQTLKSVS